jgi:hypothetical protein
MNVPYHLMVWLLDRQFNSAFSTGRCPCTGSAGVISCILFVGGASDGLPLLWRFAFGLSDQILLMPSGYGTYLVDILTIGEAKLLSWGQWFRRFRVNDFEAGFCVWLQYWLGKIGAGYW